MVTKETSPSIELRRIGASFIVSRCIYVAAKLGIADMLIDGNRHVDELASEAGVDSSILYRILRMLAGEGILLEIPERNFGLTSVGQALRSDSPDSLRAYMVMIHDPTFKAWTEIMHSLETSESPFDKTFGMPYYDYMEADPEHSETFQAAMIEVQRTQRFDLTNYYDFADVTCVADIGGGNGSLLSPILVKYGHISGILFEREPALNAARDGKGGPLPRCNFVNGDFFKEVVREAQIYILERVLHGWDNKAATIILENCRRAMDSGNRLLVIEALLGEPNEPSWANYLDLMMLTTSGGMERTEREYELLLNSTGFGVEQVIPTPSDYSIICGVAR